MNRFVCLLPEPEFFDADSAIRWFRMSSSGALLASGTAPCSDLKSHVSDLDVVVAIVPGERVTLHRVLLPMRSRAAQVRALPFALEEQLCEDIDSLHIVAGKRDGRGVHAAVVAHRDMEAWLLGLRAAGLEPRWMVPDSLLLPVAESGVLNRLAFSGRCLVRAEDAEPVVLAEHLCAVWKEHEERRLGKALHWNTLDSGVESGTPEAFLLGQLRLPATLNLLTGRHAGRNRSVLEWRQWRIPAALAVGVLVLWWVSLLLEVRQLEQAVTGVDYGIETLFQETLPGTRMVDPVRQFRLLLDSNTSSENASESVLAQLAVVAEATTGQQAVAVRQLRVDADRVELELAVDSLAGLEQLRSRLASAGSHEVSILSADSDGEGIRARIQMGVQR